MDGKVLHGQMDGLGTVPITRSKEEEKGNEILTQDLVRAAVLVKEDGQQP